MRSSSQQTALGILQNRVAASVALIAALGGGWDTSQLPQILNRPDVPDDMGPDMTEQGPRPDDGGLVSDYQPGRLIRLCCGWPLLSSGRIIPLLLFVVLLLLDLLVRRAAAIAAIREDCSGQ